MSPHSSRNRAYCPHAAPKAYHRIDTCRKHDVLKNAPFTIAAVSADIWPYSFSRTDAAWPKGLDRRRKFWSPVSRIDNALGDRVLICSCPPVEALTDA